MTERGERKQKQQTLKASETIVHSFNKTMLFGFGLYSLCKILG